MIVNLRLIRRFMRKITITKLYDLLIPKLGKETAESLTTYLETKISNEVEDNTKSLATKENVANVRTEVESVRTELANVKTEVGSVRTELANVKTEVGSIRTEVSDLRVEVAGLKTEMANVRTAVANVRGELFEKMGQNSSIIIRWMFVFWIGQMAATISVILLFVKK